MSKPRKEIAQENLRTIYNELFDWLDAIIWAVVIVVILFTFAFRTVGIKGSSMENTLLDGDRVVITDLCYEPKYDDIVVISRNYLNDNTGSGEFAQPIIKRVIATEGQWVDIDFDKGVVYVDGLALEEDYVKMPTTVSRDVEFPLYVPKGKVFVLGDNRDISNDSRSSDIGLVDERHILGKAIYRILPFQSIGALN